MLVYRSFLSDIVICQFRWRETARLQCLGPPPFLLMSRESLQVDSVPSKPC